MYRARVDAVSGTRVYADGKWLRCIGNKNVSVGDYVWTDGRCVYGHLQESQQPQVILSPHDDEGIPVLLFDDKCHFYTYKSRLKELNCTENTDDSDNEDDEQSKCPLMINDKRGNVFVYDEAPIIVANKGTSTTYRKIVAANIDRQGNRYYLVAEYTDTINYDDGEPYVESCVDYIKILKNGNEVKSVDVRYLKQSQGFPTTIGTTPSEDVLYRIQELSESVESEIVSPFIENEKKWSCVLNLVFYKAFPVYTIKYAEFYAFRPTESESLHFIRQNYGNYFFGSESMLNALREARDAAAEKALELATTGENPESAAIPIEFNETLPDDIPYANRRATIVFSGGAISISGDRYSMSAAVAALGINAVYPSEEYTEVHEESRCIFLSSDVQSENDEFVLFKYSHIAFFGIFGVPSYCEPKRTYEYPDVEKAVFPLQDGCYYTLRSHPNKELSTDSKGRRYYYIRDFFAPSGKKIFSYTSDLLSQSVIARTKNGYLLGTRSSDRNAGWAPPFVVNELSSNQPDYDGIFSYKNEQWTKLATGMCLNERLKPMKKICNWQNRLQNIELEQTEI